MCMLSVRLEPWPSRNIHPVEVASSAGKFWNCIAGRGSGTATGAGDLYHPGQAGKSGRRQGADTRAAGISCRGWFCDRLSATDQGNGMGTFRTFEPVDSSDDRRNRHGRRPYGQNRRLSMKIGGGVAMNKYLAALMAALGLVASGFTPAAAGVLMNETET